LDAQSRKERDARRRLLYERMAGRFKELVSFACSSLARDERSRRDDFFAELARSLLDFNETLAEADQEYPFYRIHERLRRAAQAGVPALGTTASLLQLGPETDPSVLAGDLVRIRESRPHDVWPMWLTYVFDQLMNSPKPPLPDSVPPDTTRDEWKKAELAFGCVLFTDDSFRVLQESMDQAASTVDDALKCGGHHVTNRPPARARNLLARFDPRALQWYGSESRPAGLLQPPPSIEAVTEPESARRQLDELWTAANFLQVALDKWASWFVELQEKGDAHPAVALNCDDMARRAVKVLVTYRPNVEPFDTADEGTLVAMLPPVPAWWLPGTDIELGGEGTPVDKPRIRWQEDRAFLDRYYCAPERLQERASQLRAAAAQLIDLLKSFPMASIAAGRDRPGAAQAARSSCETEAPDDVLASLLSQAESRRREEEEAYRVAEERTRRLGERIASRERLAGAFDRAYAFPNEERQEGRKPCPEGFHRWAERFVALGYVLRECDKATERPWLIESLRKVAATAAPPPMKYACALLLVAAGERADVLPRVASALEEANRDEDLRRFVLWLPFILDSLWQPYPNERGLIFTAGPPTGTSQEERIRAERAFGSRPLASSDDSPPPAPIEHVSGEAAGEQEPLDQRLSEDETAKTCERWPLVAERTSRRNARRDLARDKNRERQSRHCQGFDPDWWVPALFAAKWRSQWYPLCATRESVGQWVAMINELCIEFLGPFAMPEEAAELETRREHDLNLIRQIAPHLLGAGPIPARSPEDSAGAPGEKTDGKRPVPPAIPERDPVRGDLSIEPGAFVYRSHKKALSGKPLRVLELLVLAGGNAVTLAALRDQCWGTESDSGEEAVRSAVATARDALRRAIKAAGVKTDRRFDPIPNVDRGTGRTAWRLALP
jgi:hypothetical protein